jgi:5-methylcytosine-specific restriction enzyme subunit McrC
MQQLTVTEYEKILRTEQNRKFLSLLQRFDEKWSNSCGETVFDWSNRRFVSARNYVGVIALPGAAIEILPKIDSTDTEGNIRAQHNLLYMLSITRKIVGEDRDLAAVGTQRMPLLEQLIAIFAARTLSELRRGIDHCYVAQEENLRCIKGKLLVGQNITANAVHASSAFCRNDDFISDTPINRMLKAASRRLLSISRVSSSQKKLREIIFTLDYVTDLDAGDHHFAEIHYSRNTDRFEPLINFSLLVMKGMSPAWSLGKESSFSLLFPMEKLFEEFIARHIYRYAEYFSIPRDLIHAQAAGRREWLLRREHDSCGSFRLKPDMIIDQRDGKPRLILDTKWKHLLTDAEDRKNGVSQADIYQLYAYAHRYECADNVLLFPHVEGVTRKSYVVDGSHCSHRIRVELIKLNRDLRREGDSFREDLKKVITGKV